MKLHHNGLLSGEERKRRSPFLGICIGVFLILFTMGSLSMIFSGEDRDLPETADRPDPIAPADGTFTAPIDDGMWDGPVLYHYPVDRPIHLLIVEKETQKLLLYRYDGNYRQIKSYFCASGENPGKKRKEKDEKTPEGIYFNDRTFRDRKVTVFGDRAFGLNYPDVFDSLAGNRGSGIFIHGSNRPVAPYSTNGCLVLDNGDIADLDGRIDLKQTPVIIGERLPYRFGRVDRDLSELIPFLKQAMLPEKYAGMPADIHELTVLGFEDRVVAVGRVTVKAAGSISGISKLYLAGPGKTLLVLVRREWAEEAEKVAAAPADAGQKSGAKAASGKPVSERERLGSMVESWRRAWEGKRLNDFIAHYHPGFSNKGKSLSDWKTYKGRLNRKNRKIAVRISDVRVRVNGEKARVYFRQRYRSDTFRSSSYKILECRKKDGRWKIFRENSFTGKPADWPA